MFPSSFQKFGLLTEHVEEKLAHIIESKPTEEDIAAFIESQNPNLPLSDWQKNAKGHKLELNGSCAKMPDPLRLRYNNIFWQEVVTSNFTLYLYSAYLEVRKRNKEGPIDEKLLQP